MTKTLDVYFGNQKAGQLIHQQNGRFAFCYDVTWLNNPEALPLSLSLPLQVEMFGEERAHPFFANLLPESDLRQTIARHLGISVKNDFTLLEMIGGECAGAISIYPEGSHPDKSGRYRALAEKELVELIRKLPKRPLLVGEQGLRLSLAGAQNKLPIYFDEKKFFLPLGNFPSSHILKPAMRDFPASISNEAFCMQLAKALNLPVAEAFIFRNQVSFYYTKRFDRESVEGKLIRLHQEDFCQALSIMPDSKYETEGGPTLQDCFKLLKQHSVQPAPDQIALLEWVMFNYFIGNADAHAKNISLLLLPNGPRLAPFYDLFCTAIYSELTDKMAMKIGGENRLEWIAWRHWQQFAKDIGVTEKFVAMGLQFMSKQIVTVAQDIAKKIIKQVPEDKKWIDKVLAFIQKQNKRVISYLEES